MKFITFYRFGLSLLLSLLIVGIAMNITGEYNNAVKGVLAIVMPLVLIAAVVVPFVIRDGWKEYKKFLFSKATIIWFICTLVVAAKIVSANI